MPANLVIAPEAELDIAEAYVWYERRRIGLGEEFLNSLDACMEGIRRQSFLVTPTLAASICFCSIALAAYLALNS
jgi:hypothetical protein